MCKQYKPQVVVVQECWQRENKVINLNGFVGITKSSVDDNSAGGVSIYINNSCLFSDIKLYTDLRVVAVRVSAKKTLTVCNTSKNVNLSDLVHSVYSFQPLLSSLAILMLTLPLWVI